MAVYSYVLKNQYACEDCAKQMGRVKNTKDWALVKTITGTYGFIDTSGKIVVEPIYAKIEKFKINSGEYALVKSIAGTYGLIDKDGKEIVKTIYANIGEFGEFGKEIALVKSVAGTYGFINKNGKEVVPLIYDQNQAKEKI